MKTNTRLFFIFFILIAFDQAIKHFSNNHLCNQNIAWNIPVSAGIFYFVWIIIIAILTYIFLKTDHFVQKVSTILIFSGAVSNFVDRLRVGCVIDYIDLKFFPVFNLADVYITIGVIFLITNTIKINRPA